jgi:hypothetical protein
MPDWSWQAHAANPAYPAIRTLSDTAYLASHSAVLMMFLIPRNNLFEKKSCPACGPSKSGAAQISTAMRVLAEIIASDVSLLLRFNHAIDAVT